MHQQGSTGAGETVARADQCLDSARNKYETAAMHGWAGVAGNLELAAESLEGVVEQLMIAEQASQTSATVLDEITAQMSSPEVVEHLVTASSGKIFDSFAPNQGKSVRNIWSVTRGKVADGQTRRVSLNLDDSDVSIDQLKEQFSRWHIQDLEEVIAVRDHEIYRIFP